MRKFTCILSTLIILISCQSTQTSKQKPHQVTEARQKPKNLILLIGDGMGPQQISALYYVAKYSKKIKLSLNDVGFKRIADSPKGMVGISATEPKGHIVVDSACSATQLAIGEFSLSETVAVDQNGNKAQTILEKAKLKGLSTGLISDTKITHATPASFGSYSLSRHYETEIAKNYLKIQPDIMLSGGISYFIPKDQELEYRSGKIARSKRNDDLDLLSKAREHGYEVIHSKEDLQNSSSQKVLGLFNSSVLPSSMWQLENENSKERQVPNLKEMTKAAVTKLSQNEKGFFLMVEGGQIDWAGHENDAANLMYEMISFNKTLNFLIDWVDKNPDTLLVVTADHETGGFGFAYHRKDVPQPTPLKGDQARNNEFVVSKNYIRGNSIDLILSQKKSFYEIFRNFRKLPQEQQTAKALQKLVLENSDYQFTEAQAQRVLQRTKNIYNYSWVKSLTGKSFKDFPIMPHGKDAFYNNMTTARSALLAQELAVQQGITWATGTHTATPVNVFAYGTGAEKFKGYKHHSEVGRIMQDLLLQ